MNKKWGPSPKIMSEINMTPFVDVMLVLLIIFIVTLPVLQHAVYINLPTSEGRVQLSTKEQLQIEINENNLILWNKETITIEQLESRSTRIAHQLVDLPVIISANKNARYETIAKVIAICRKSGLEKINLKTN